MEEIKTITLDVDIQKQTSTQSGSIVSTSFWVEEFVFQRKLRSVAFFIIGGFSLVFFWRTFGMGLSSIAPAFSVFIILRFIDLRLFSNKRDILTLSNRTLFVHYCLTIIRLPVYFLIGFLLPSIRAIREIGLDTGVLIILPFLLSIFFIDVSIIFIKNKIIKPVCIIVLISMFCFAYWVVSAPGRFFSFINPNALKKNITSTSSDTAVPDLSYLSYHTWKRLPLLRQDPSIDSVDNNEKDHIFFFAGIQTGYEVVIFDSNHNIVGEGITENVIFPKNGIFSALPEGWNWPTHSKVIFKRPLVENEILTVALYDMSYKYKNERQERGWYRNAKNERVSYTITVINKENEKQKNEQQAKQAMLNSLRIKKFDFTSGSNNAQIRISVPFDIHYLFEQSGGWLVFFDVLNKYIGDKVSVHFRPSWGMSRFRYTDKLNDSTIVEADLKYLKYIKCAQDQGKSLLYIEKITKMYQTDFQGLKSKFGNSAFWNSNFTIKDRDSAYETIKYNIFNSFDLSSIKLDEKQFSECLSSTMLRSSDYFEPGELRSDSYLNFEHQFIIINNEITVKGVKGSFGEITEDDIKNALDSISR